MQRLFSRALVALSMTTAVAVAVPAPHALAFPDQCTNERSGSPILSGSTANPYSTYVLTTDGLTLYVAGIGTVEVYANTFDVGVEVHGIVNAHVGVDPSGGGTYGREWELAACGTIGTAGGNLYADIDDPAPTRTGVVVSLILCSPTGVCQTILGHTGFELNAGVPATSCVWIDGRQQNPVGSCPAVDPGSGLPL